MASFLYGAIEDSRVLESLFTEVSRQIAKPHKDYRLLAPFLSVITPEKHQSSQYVDAQSRTKHYKANANELDTLGSQLLQKLARLPLTILIVNTKKQRWAAFSPLLGLESTIIVEQRLVDIIKLGGPDSRLFGFMVAYHGFGYLIRKWVSNSTFPCCWLLK